MKFEVSLFILVMKMESDISKITLALASCPGQPDARCVRGNLAPTWRMVAMNNSIEFVLKESHLLCVEPNILKEPKNP